MENNIPENYLRLLRTPRTFALFADVLFCSFAELPLPRLEPEFLLGAAFDDDDVVVVGIVVVGDVVTAFPLLLDDVTLLINVDGGVL